MRTQKEIASQANNIQRALRKQQPIRVASKLMAARAVLNWCLGKSDVLPTEYVEMMVEMEKAGRAAARKFARDRGEK